MTISKRRFKGRFSVGEATPTAHRGTSSDSGLVSNKMLKWLWKNCSNLLTKVRVTIDPRQSGSGLKPLPTHSRSGRRIDTAVRRHMEDTLNSLPLFE